MNINISRNKIGINVKDLVITQTHYFMIIKNSDGQTYSILDLEFGTTLFKKNSLSELEKTINDNYTVCKIVKSDNLIINEIL